MMELLGTKCPKGERIYVHSTATRMAAGWNATDQYSSALTRGADATVEIPMTRFDLAQYYIPPTEPVIPPWNTIFNHMAFVEGLEFFDNKYFNIPAQESLGMDPMHKHLLETGAMALQKLGISKKFADQNPHHGGLAVGMDKDDFDSVPHDPIVDATGGQNVQAIIANRFSYTFNLKGASFVTDTACSSSLSCTHMATLMIENRRTDKLEFFLSAGLHQCHSPNPWIGMSQSHMVSSVGRCTTFNQSADGYMRGDACSVMTLKWGDEPDEREAIWRGSMVCQNGRSATMTAPNGIAQQSVIWKAIREAESAPGETTIWSCHGTGTNLGDPIEISSMRKVIAEGGARDHPLIVGTNKTNCGHYEGGAAMTSLISAVCQLKSQVANPCIHLNVLNPHLDLNDFDGTFITETSLTNMHQCQMQVSSFGFGGTNVNAVLWGLNKDLASDPKKLWQNQLKKMKAPEIRAVGNDPAEWDSDLPGQAAKPGEVWSISVDKDGPPGAMRWEKTEEGLGDEYDPDDVSYSIIGSFNEWVPEMMEDADVPGLRTITIDMPASGQVEFRFVQTVEEDVVLAPASDKCSKKTAPIEGPAPGLTNSWVARGAEGTSLKINLFTSYKRKAVSWLMC